MTTNTIPLGAVLPSRAATQHKPPTPGDNCRVWKTQQLPSPAQLKSQLPLSDALKKCVKDTRQAIGSIISGKDDRLLVVVGPCSIHDPAAAADYAQRLTHLNHEFHETMLLVMRVYFEKPRTTVGWKGLINDPFLDGSSDIETGLKTARAVLREVLDMGLPTATEFLDPIVPPYIGDLVCWAAIGARTTESQTHREMASGLDMPVGFKNGTDGSLQTAVDAMAAARHPHSFLGIDQNGVTSVHRTSGNHESHVILRGGRGCTNYDTKSIQEAASQLTQANLPRAIMVDCAHANSCKSLDRQGKILQSTIQEKAAGNQAVIGVMFESNLVGGSQALRHDKNSLSYGLSITDPCAGWESTEQMLRVAHKALRN